MTSRSAHKDHRMPLGGTAIQVMHLKSLSVEHLKFSLLCAKCHHGDCQCARSTTTDQEFTGVDLTQIDSQTEVKLVCPMWWAPDSGWRILNGRPLDGCPSVPAMQDVPTVTIDLHSLNPDIYKPRGHANRAWWLAARSFNQIPLPQTLVEPLLAVA
ncbi:hypothetical protein BDZ45DRAFT_737719 [Acephala macrosclerotiorum]|nr:hypothetical protein BDZ45DRAFT_737719 [Acephala macrosclerotiorum]